MKKELRMQVYNKYNGHCAYCSNEITYKQMQVDHIIPQSTFTQCIRNKDLDVKFYKVPEFLMHLELGDQDHFDNLAPACARCNRYKKSNSLESFREQISKQVERARKTSWNFRCAEDYGFIEIINKPVEFYFEKSEE
jgi:5-methylcytosine-specific restriction endonuclease McrA